MRERSAICVVFEHFNEFLCALETAVCRGRSCEGQHLIKRKHKKEKRQRERNKRQKREREREREQFV